MKNIKFILIVLILIGTGCKDRPRSNPFDPDTVLDTSQWAPSNLQAEVINDSQIRLTWQQNDDRIDGFRILRKAGSSNYFQVAEITSDSTHYTDTGLSLGVTYTYRVKAFTNINESDFTETSYYFWQDCSGVWNGSAVVDCTGQCGGTAVIDCTGVCDGSAFINTCDYCVGGNTGLDASYCPVTDIDDNSYETVQIGTQLWMAENLKVTHYRNGDPIPTGYSDSEWASLSTGAYGVYNNDPSNTETYGNLYNWYAVDGTRDVCPVGWHVPTDEEWMELEMTLGMSSGEAHDYGWRGTNEGSKMAGNAELWSNGNLENNGEFGTSGFLALPGGYRNYGNGYYDHMGYSGYFWSTTAYESSYAWNRGLSYYNSDVYRNYYDKRLGFSIRCAGD